MPDSHLSAVPDQPDEDMFTTVPVCPTCPPHQIGFWTTKRETDWEFTLWHLEPCPRAGEPPAVIQVPGCEICHNWPSTDVQLGDLVIPGYWAAHSKHGKTPVTSRDGTLETAAGGDYCPNMEPDNARFERVLARSESGA